MNTSANSPEQKYLNDLYTLSLSIGQSLDLSENITRFVTALMAIRNFTSADVWIKKSLYENPEVSLDEFGLIYSYIPNKEISSTISVSHPIIEELKIRDYCFIDTKSQHFNALSDLHHDTDGTLLFLRLGDLGFIKIHDSKWADFAKKEINDLLILMRRFSTSIEGCLSHNAFLNQKTGMTKVYSQPDLPEGNDQESNREKYQHIFNSIIDAYAEVDFQTGTIIEITPSIKIFSGYDRMELIGRKMKDFYKNAEQDHLSLVEELTKNKGQLTDYEVTLINKEGQPVACSFSIKIVFDNHGNPLKTVGTMRDVSSRKKTEKALIEAEKRWRILIENSPDCILVVKPDGIIHFQNTKSSTKRDQILGKSIFQIVPEHHIEEYRYCINRILQSNETVSREIIGIDNTWTLSRFVPVSDSTGIELIMIIATDITAQKELEMKLNTAIHDAESANQAKSRFLANMSHEIRNPMSAIIGNAEILSKTTLDEKQNQILQDLMLSADSLLDLIDNVLDLSKIEANQLMLDFSNYNLQDEICKLVSPLRSRASLKNIELNFDIDKHVPEYIFADRLRINQILFNLLDNSLKFTNNGSISLNCTLLESNVEGHILSFSLKDTGSGIDQQDIDALFNAHMSGHPEHGYKKTGPGLGLSIAKQLVELMQGEITIQSKKYFGTEVSFTILVKNGTSKLTIKEPQTPVENKILLLGKTILFVEDNPLNQEIGKKIITDWGGEVLIAENGFEAIETITELGDKIDLVFMDIRMPIMDGIEATSMIRNSLKWEKPIIALTGEALKEKIEECYRVGMNDYISKPFRQLTIEKKLRKFLFPSAIEEDGVIEKEVEEVEITEEYSTELLMEMIGGDQDQLATLLMTFINQGNANLTNLKQALLDKNWDQLRTQAHTFKTSFKYLKLNQSAALCEKLEHLASLEKEEAEIPTLSKNIEIAFNAAVKQIQNDID